MLLARKPTALMDAEGEAIDTAQPNQEREREITD